MHEEFARKAEFAMANATVYAEKVIHRAARFLGATASVNKLLADLGVLDSIAHLQSVVISETDDHNAALDLYLKPDHPDTPLLRDIAKALGVKIEKTPHWSGESLKASFTVNNIKVTIHGYKPATCRIVEEPVEEVVSGARVTEDGRIVATKIKRHVVCEPPEENRGSDPLEPIIPEEESVQDFERIVADLLPELTRQFGEDAAQEAVSKTWERLAAGATIDNFDHYLRVSAANARRMAFRRQKRAPVLVEFHSKPVSSYSNGQLNPYVRENHPSLIQHAEQDRRAEARQLIERADPRLLRYGLDGETSGLTDNGLRALRRRQVRKLLVLAFYYVMAWGDESTHYEPARFTIYGPFPTLAACQADQQSYPGQELPGVMSECFFTEE